MTRQQLEAMIAAAQDDTPRMKCLKKCQADHNACLAAAGSDEGKKSACNKALANCVQGCPPP